MKNVVTDTSLEKVYAKKFKMSAKSMITQEFVYNVITTITYPMDIVSLLIHYVLQPITKDIVQAAIRIM